ncbi:hypothetical protein [Planctomicrobium sp. SH527]|uniref:hypothetical protein n=1 Tax=Planctomicrobium sp. SH527 TaxID=3448123 RepID=UPI003F5AFAD2
MHVMDLKTLSERSGISPRHLRYVLDHSLVPGSLLTENLPILGRTRIVDEMSAVYIACSGHLLHAGYRGEAVRDMMTAFGSILAKTQLHLPHFREVVELNMDGQVHYGDGHYVRWIVAGKIGPWQDPTRKGKTVELTPKSYFVLDVGEITKAVRVPDSTRKSLDS